MLINRAYGYINALTAICDQGSRIRRSENQTFVMKFINGLYLADAIATGKSAIIISCAPIGQKPGKHHIIPSVSFTDIFVFCSGLEMQRTIVSNYVFNTYY